MKLITELVGLNGIKFILEDKEKTLSLESLKELKRTISQYLEYVEHWNHYIKLYENYDIEQELEDLYDKERNIYSVGNVFYQYIDTNNVTDYFKEKLDYFDELDIDETRDFVYIYIKSKDITRKFLTWSYETLIKPKLDKIKKASNYLS